MELIIIGGGASGLTLASMLKTQNANINITIIEKLEHVGKKILVSGNGKCNLSNANINQDSYNNEFGYKIASNFDANNYFNNLGLLTIKDQQGRIYPNSLVSNSVLDILRENLDGVKIIENTNIIRITKENNQYKLMSDNFDFYMADMLVLACGGKTFYKDCNSYQLASMLGHRITSLRPSLTPIYVNQNMASIENLRCKAKASLISKGNVIYQDIGEVLFKKNYLSGIVMFQLSSHIAKEPFRKYEIELDLIPDIDLHLLTDYITNHPKMTGLFAKMINQYILKETSSTNPDDIAYTIKHLKFDVIENIDYKNAQVTSGGIDIKEVNENLESKNNPNVYFAGEILDVDGICGGYNLHFAFSCANIISKDIINKVGVNNEK